MPTCIRQSKTGTANSFQFADGIHFGTGYFNFPFHKENAIYSLYGLGLQQTFHFLLAEQISPSNTLTQKANNSYYLYAES